MDPTDPTPVAEVVARFLVEHGVDRVFGLQGGHIQPIWDRLARRGVRIVDVRDEDCLRGRVCQCDASARE